MTKRKQRRHLKAGPVSDAHKQQHVKKEGTRERNMKIMARRRRHAQTTAAAARSSSCCCPQHEKRREEGSTSCHQSVRAVRGQPLYFRSSTTGSKEDFTDAVLRRGSRPPEPGTSISSMLLMLNSGTAMPLVAMAIEVVLFRHDWWCSTMGPSGTASTRNEVAAFNTLRSRPLCCQVSDPPADMAPAAAAVAAGTTAVVAADRGAAAPPPLAAAGASSE